MDSDYFGYKGRVAEILRKKNVSVGDRIVIKKKEKVFEGVLMPREKLYGDKPIIVIKLNNGYNIGVRVDEYTEIFIKQKRSTITPSLKPRVRTQNLDLPKVTLLSTGGTIVSKVDYETGAVRPALSVEELIEFIPEISDIAVLDAREILNVFSEDITPRDWEKIAREIYEEMLEGVDGIVVAHGTDMMAYTAAAMAFAIRNKPVPIVFVGAQRSSDRPSSDSAFNLLSAFLTASRAPFAESVVVMHGETGDTYALAHRGVKVRKMHTSRRDAFQTINDKPLAVIDPYEKKIKIVNKIIEERNKQKEPVLENKFDEKVALIKAYPGFQIDIIHYLVDKKYHGIVIEGSGLGHITNRVVDAIKRAVEEEIPVVMTSQCLFGRVDMYVYSTGRRLIEAGVIPGNDMLPETAYVKLSWILGSKTRNLDEVRALMTTNTAGEMNPRLTIDLYPRWPHI
ncbi:MAG: Glu-tRNA(Gln) amidotransferase subunit GatD [Staphylothermus sp.]|nr:Glu-tRNA(Gln) amidotransferase subunit GatD [Staphylothermus sp.]